MTKQDAFEVVLGRIQGAGHVPAEQRARRDVAGFAIDTHCTRCGKVVELIVFPDHLGRACCGGVVAACVAQPARLPVGAEDEQNVDLGDEDEAPAEPPPAEPEPEPQA